jgi:hypothetical protein
MGMVTTFQLREEHDDITRSTEIFSIHPAGLCAYGITVVQCMANEVFTVMSQLFICHFHTHYIRTTTCCHVFGTDFCMCVVLTCS